MGQALDAGFDVILNVHSVGRPAPRYQWHTNGVPITTPTASSSFTPRLVCFANCGPFWRNPATDSNDLVLRNVQPWQSGLYFVEAFNGLERATSAVVTLVVNNILSAPTFECPVGEPCPPAAVATLTAERSQTAILTFQARGFPTPTVQWSRSLDGVTFADLPGQTGNDLSIANLQDSDAGLYRVRLQNSLGATSAVARVFLRPSPRLVITEVMAQACSALNRDWWELTNTNSEPVNLCGYRWDDETATGNNSLLSIGAGPTITNDVVLGPGASVILMESQSAASFVEWWGASNLPPKLQLITYSNNGLGEMGDSLNVWDPNETDGTRVVAQVVFSTAVRGATTWFDPFTWLEENCLDAEAGVPSSNGFCGAFQASVGCEIGSPGWTRWTPPELTAVVRNGADAMLHWRAQPGSLNRVQFARQIAMPLSETLWEDLGDFQSSRAACSAVDSNLGSEPQRFYRVRRVAAAECSCPQDNSSP